MIGRSGQGLVSRSLRARWTSWVLVGVPTALLAACGNKAAPPPTTPPVESSPAPFENPGGMWMPHQLAEHADTLKQLGLGYDPSALTDPTAFPLGAVVSLGGCSASFVSPDGLIITNHHCVIGALQHNSTEDRNLLVDGFLARERADEPSAGPTARVYVTTAFTDVTEDMMTGIAEIEDPTQRHRELAKRKKSIETECEEKKPEHRCSVRDYFGGAEFYRIEQLQIRDVRLVHAPHSGIGVFGGEVDNWRWPRHTGDYAFLRAYVGADGRPADHAETNVPYRPPHHLKVAKEPLAPGDFVMVAGYPGRTFRLTTAAEVRDAVQWYYPRAIERFAAEIALLTALGEERPELAIKSASRMRRRANYHTNFQGMLDGLVQDGLAERKAGLEKELQSWIDADPDRKAKWGSVLAQMEQAGEEKRTHRDHDGAVMEILEASALLGAAISIHAAADARAEKDDDSADATDEDDAAQREQRMKAMSRSYDPALDKALLRLAITRAGSLPEEQQPKALIEAIVGSASPSDEAAVTKALDKLFAKTKLGDEKTRSKLLASATPTTLARNKDSFLRLAATAVQMRKQARERDARLEGAMAALRPAYIAALRAFVDGPLSPDANGTLRVTYGTVRGYRPSPEKEPFAPFTTLTEMVAKHTGEQPFAAPEAILSAAKGELGPYLDETLGDVPVNFLADLDITGGNSGSATLNRNGELVGLAFDGNYESIASDWLFIPEVTRSIHVDIRYVLWVMDAVDGAHHLIEEMGVPPRTAEEAANAPAQPVAEASP
jgi:hypothetical protein